MALQDATSEAPPGLIRGPHTGSHLLNIRNARIRSENDVTLLRNRLERLAQEERKAVKKIEDTRRRAEQIIQLKTRNERTHLRKQMEAEYAERQKERARERLMQSKLEMSDTVQANQQAVQNQKKQGANHLREQRSMINEHLRQRQEEQLDRNRKVTEVGGSSDELASAHGGVSLAPCPSRPAPTPCTVDSRARSRCAATEDAGAHGL
eukprot:scaffold1084_cov114-Isochrysis_galbana.AAC.8